MTESAPAHLTPESGETWSVVIPIKGGPAAKTRLADLPDDARQVLADAMALDVVAAAGDTATVAKVFVVTNDTHVAWAAAALGAVIVADPGAGLNAALHAPDVTGRCAFLLADLPALTPAALAHTLAVARAHDMGFVVDAAGTGTTLATVSDVRTTTYFGAESARRHAAAGFTSLAPVPLVVTRDVDTVADLAAAAALGLGARTALVYADLQRVGLIAT